MKTKFSVLLGLILFFNCIALEAQLMYNQIILIRHAESKMDGSINPGLSNTGKETAQKLANVLKDINISTIITTNTNRAKETAGPIAAIRAIEPRVIDSVEETVHALSEQIGYNETALVVGHVNTIPQIIKHLKGPQVMIGEYDFRKMYIVTMLSYAELTTLELNY